MVLGRADMLDLAYCGLADISAAIVGHEDTQDVSKKKAAAERKKPEPTGAG